MNHAKLGYGGSVAARTIACPGWINQCSRLPPEALGGSSDAADRGTLCHNAMELLLLNKVSKPSALLGLRFAGHQMDKELLNEAVLPAWDAYQKFQDRNWAHRWIERRVDLGVKGIKSGTCHGTADLIHLYDDALEIGDWKFGRIPVSPTSDQLHFYAAGALESVPEILALELPFDFPVTLTIWQPFVSYEPLRHTTTVERLAVWKSSYSAAVHQAQRIAPPLKMGKHCDYCPAKLICPEIRREVPFLMKMDPKLLDSDTLSQLAKDSSAATGLQDAAFTELKTALLAGVDVADWKLVQGNKRRFWKDPVEAATVLESYGIEPLTQTVISVAEAGRQFKERGVDIYDVMRDHIEEGRNPPRVVPADAPGATLPNFSAYGKALGHISAVR